MLQTLRSDNLVLSSDDSCVVVSRVAVMEGLKLAKWPRGNRYKDDSVMCECPSQKPWGECMLMVPVWQQRHSCFDCLIIARI